MKKTVGILGSMLFTLLLLLPVGSLGFLLLRFSGIGENTVVNTVESPNGVYYAEVIDSDQGALGGDTLVDVYDRRENKSQRVYAGEWGEFEDMEIYWKNDTCLVINSVEYTFPE